ncbi:MAG TPA: acyl-ACP--UDP-N-acetylglucosamine O-acyltransferase [Verrucomicrobiae bacterium]|jgi:UDP-N-acetylglucosamine acyltransferase|nr:acyl-ACP--UDP-N-acetylglucosamine O-acyltransferase [Verrucomicrobiae bacterium]
MIHPTAVLNPKAQIDSTVQIGPYAVVDGDVSIGAGCRIGPHVYITGHTTIGANNRFHAGCVIGDAPQDVKYKDEPTRLVIGASNLFREGATVHRSAVPDEATTIGSDNFLMVNCHVGHNVRLGDNVIVVNGALLAGHAQVADRVFISGNCLVHQFVRIGTLAIMQGGAAISQDLPPYTVASRTNVLCGLNVIGLRRAGISPEERLELKRLYQKLFLSGTNLTQAVAEAQSEFTSAPARVMLEFIPASKRGVCRHQGRAED